MKPKQEDPKEMVGGCCVCSDENGWAENPLVYCDGQGCNVAVHQACYGIVTVPTGSWFCRKCESQERAARVRCELCPSKDGALKRTDSGGWAHVVCALYIPEVRFGNVTTMEPIMLQLIPQERFNKSCYLCDEAQRGSKATIGACMQCNRAGCKNHFHVTCAQAMGLLCEEAGNYLDNVKYCGYCQYHYNKLRRGSHVKTIPPYRPVPHDSVSSDEDKTSDSKDLKLKKRSTKSSPIHDSNKQLTREVKVNLGELSGSSKSNTSVNSNGGENSQEQSASSEFSVSVVQNSGLSIKSDSKSNDKLQSNSSNVPNITTSSASTSVKHSTPISVGASDSKTNTVTSVTFPSSNLSLTSVSLSSSSSASVITSEAVIAASGALSATPQSSVTVPSPTCTASSSVMSEMQTSVVSSVSTIVSLPSKIKTMSSALPISSHSQSTLSVSLTNSNIEKDKHRKIRRNGPRSSGTATVGDTDGALSNEGENQTKEGTLTICEERNLSVDREKTLSKVQNFPEDPKLNVQYMPNVCVQGHKVETFHSVNSDAALGDPMKRSRSNSQDRGRRSKRGSSGGGGSVSKRGRVAMPSRESAKDNRDSGASSPESLASDLAPKRGRGSKLDIKESKESQNQNTVITNGVGANTLLLGNQINPSSSMAQKMTDTLNSELEAHSIYKEEEKVNTALIGPSLPGKRETSTPGSVLNSGQPPPLPQSLEQLLERQWEQGSQFLMEQAQHFDIASLLSCLHQLRQENVRLEETVNNLVARRDHLLAVNARLSVPLGSSQTSSQTSSSTTLSSSTSVSASSSHPTSSPSLVSITPSGPSSISSSLVGGHGSQISHTGSTSASLLPSSRAHAQQRHPSGGTSHPSLSNPPSSISGRGTSPHDRRAPHQGPPVENGLGEPEYRYRSPGTDHQHRQQSPMLPPGAQPSPTAMRQSPASSGYHSGSSPHTGVPSLSPSSVSHPPPPHTLVAHVPAHGHPPIMASSSHGPPHSVALSRAPEHSRAELVRLTSTQPHSNPSGGYPVYQMVSPPVPGPHHSPVGMSQHPSHSQVLRREVVDSARSSHSLEKR